MLLLSQFRVFGFGSKEILRDFPGREWCDDSKRDQSAYGRGKGISHDLIGKHVYDVWINPNPVYWN